MKADDPIDRLLDLFKDPGAIVAVRMLIRNLAVLEGEPEDPIGDRQKSYRIYAVLANFVSRRPEIADRSLAELSDEEIDAMVFDFIDQGNRGDPQMLSLGTLRKTE